MLWVDFSVTLSVSTKFINDAVRLSKVTSSSLYTYLPMANPWSRISFSVSKCSEIESAASIFVEKIRLKNRGLIYIRILVQLLQHCLRCKHPLCLIRIIAFLLFSFNSFLLLFIQWVSWYVQIFVNYLYLECLLIMITEYYKRSTHITEINWECNKKDINGDHHTIPIMSTRYNLGNRTRENSVRSWGLCLALFFSGVKCKYKECKLERISALIFRCQHSVVLL